MLKFALIQPTLYISYDFSGSPCCDFLSWTHCTDRFEFEIISSHYLHIQSTQKSSGLCLDYKKEFTKTWNIHDDKG